MIFIDFLRKLFKSTDSGTEIIPLNSRLNLNADGPLLLEDIQKYLLLPILNEERFPYFKCKRIDINQRETLSKCLILIVDGIESLHYSNDQRKLNNLRQGYVQIEVLGADLEAVINVLSVILMISVQKDELIKKYGCIDVCLKQLNNPNMMLRSIYPIDNTPTKRLLNYNRLSLLLSPSEMVHEKYPVPIPGLLKRKYAYYQFTKETYEPVTESSPMFGLDCERCDTQGGSELFRVSIVDEYDQTVYNSYVLPEYELVGMRYTFSEITRKELLQVKTTKKDVQEQIRELLPPDAILIGQSLNYDLIALGMMHPYVINTSCVYNSTGSRFWKSKLKYFTRKYLDRDIQVRGKGHCSIEDSKAAIDLVKLKLSNSPQFGDVILESQKEKHEKDSKSNKNVKYSTPTLIGKKGILEKYKQYMNNTNYLKYLQLKTCKDFKEITNQTLRLIKEGDFVLSHLDVNILNEKEVGIFNKFIRKLWKRCTNQTIISILLTENNKQNGFLLCNIKK